MLALISRAQRAFANCDRTARIMAVIALVLIGLVINGALILTNYWAITTVEVAGFLQRPVIKGQDDVTYIKSYISPNLYLTKREWQPKSTSILCYNSTETVKSVYLYSRLRADGKYRGSLTCPDTLQNNICSGHTYLEDPKLKNILHNVSPYLTYNLLTENDLQMASLALEYKNRKPSTYKPNYEDPKIAYLFMSESTPSWLHYAFDHIFNKTSNDTLVYSTFDYNSAASEEFSNVMQRYPQVKELPARWFGNWGGISLVYMEVSGWLELLKEEGWDYLINVSDGDGFILSADVIQQRVKELNGQSILECSYEAPYSRGHNDSCLAVDDSYRYNDVWLDCGSSIRTINHPNFSPKYPPYINRALKASQWKVLTRSVIEKLVASQDFWDILFSHRYAMIPDEHAIVNGVKRVLPEEPFIYHNVHWKSWNGEKYFDEQDVLSAIERGSWFIRRIRKLEEWAVVERVREEQYAKNLLLKKEELTTDIIVSEPSVL